MKISNMISYIGLLMTMVIVRKGTLKYIYNKRRRELINQRESLKELIKSIKRV